MLPVLFRILLAWSCFVYCFRSIYSNEDSWECPAHTNHVRRWNVSDQTELDEFTERTTAYFDTDGSANRCITLTLNDGAYQLDIVKIMQIRFKAGDSLIVVGVAGQVLIDCIGNPKEVRAEVIKTLSNVSLFVLDALTFVGCPTPITLEKVSNVFVYNCIFRNHKHGALNIFNSPKVTVKNCVFENNNSTSILKPYRGNSGGLSVSYNTELAALDSIDVLITACVFVNNRADPPSDLFLSTTRLLQNKVFSGRGGGLCMPVNAVCPVNIIVNNSTFINNFAANYGGGLYCYVFGIVGNQTYTFSNNLFIRNKATIGSGALNFQNYGSTLPFTALHSTIYNCTFEGNLARGGGCSHLITSLVGAAGNFIKYEKCMFYNNSATEYGSSIDIVSHNYNKDRQHYDPVEFTNCTFRSNYGKDGGAIVQLSFHSGKFENVSFIDNRGPVIRAVGTILHFHGNISFTNNNAKGFDGGALYLLTFSQMILNAGAHLEFINNTGGLGAAIVVETGTLLSAYTVNAYNPLCFIQYYDTFVSPNDWKKVSVEFKSNEAIIGSAIYISGLDLCSWYSPDAPYIYTNKVDILRWSIIFYGNGSDSNINTGHSEENAFNRSLTVQTPANNFIIQGVNVTSYPGESFQVTVSSYDEQNYLTYENFRIENLDSKDITLLFDPTVQTVQPSTRTFDVKYAIGSNERLSDSILEDVYNVKVSSLTIQSMLNQSKVKYIGLTIKPCPPGHVLRVIDAYDNKYECRCNDDDTNIVDCKSNNNKITLKEGLWAHYINNGSVNSILEYYYCPPGYCQCRRVDKSSEACNSVYYYNNEDLQCVCDRQGILCGKCRHGNGTSVLLNKCKFCKHTSLLLIMALVIIDGLVVSTILLSSISIPAWFYPLIFYIQVIPIIAQYFPAPFGIAQPYLQYISSATSLYFPYDFCLYPGMTAVAAYSFRYIPFLLFILISAILYIVNRKHKITCTKKRRLSWRGLWLITLLLYTDVVNTSVSILNCPTLRDSSGRKSPRWYIDGTVECFTGEHAPLAVLAILVLVYSSLLILFTAIAAIRKVKKQWIFSIAKLLKVPYTNNYYWWAPVELLKRFLFVIVSVTSPGNLAPVLLLSMIYIAVFTYIKPYHSFYINILEVFTLVDIVIQLIIASTNRFKDPVFKEQNELVSEQLIDECGKVQSISEHAAILVPFYYLPLVILVLLVGKTIAGRLHAVHINRLQKKHTKRQKRVKHDFDNDYELISEPILSSYIEFDDKKELLITHTIQEFY